MTPRQSQPGRAPTQPDDVKDYQAAGVFALIASVLVNGLSMAARFKKSLRVGGGSFASFDGFDGAIVADGTVATFVATDRGGTSNRLNIYRNGTKFYLATNDGGATLIEFDALTGLVTQDALTALTAGTSITLGASGFVPPGSRLVKPPGFVYLSVQLTTTGAIGATATLATVALAHRPAAAAVPLAFRKATGGTFSGYVLSDGTIHMDTALVLGDAVSAVASYYQ